MRFGVGLPTCTAGMMYPTPFASAEEVVDVAIEAERLGYFEVAGNDHISTQRYVRESYPTPPDFFEPLVVYAYVAARTTTLRLMTGILVLPMRQPVLLAKQLATLDHLSGGRVILGTGVGAYREELEASQPRMRGVNRGRLMGESLAALRVLFSERVASFKGEYVEFDDVEMFPKPIQDPLPIYPGGNADASLRRAAKWGQGWLPAGIGPETIAEKRETLLRYAEEEGRDGTAISVAPQVMVRLGDTHEQAEAEFKESQLYHHLVTLQQSTLKDFSADTFVAANLVGTADEVIEKVAAFADAGADHLCGMYFAANSLEDMRDQMRLFARDVMPAFAGREAVA